MKILLISFLTIFFCFVSNLVYSKDPFNGQNFWIITRTEINIDLNNNFNRVYTDTTHNFNKSKSECENKLIKFVDKKSVLKKGVDGIFVGQYNKTPMYSHITTWTCTELSSLFFNLK